jgi:soluble P-type ATPase
MGIEHFNVMHGEKLFNIRDSFFRYSKCYVWDEFYIDLFKKLRAEPSQFIVNVPKSINFSDMKNIDKQYDYTYYLGAETGDVLKKIVDSLQKLSSRGYKVCVRPHPRYTNLSELINLLDEKNIVQESNNFEIEESVMKTRNAVSCYSTVLNQAYHSCVSIVIDDISNPVAYEKLKELDYVMLNVEHRKLSEILEET